MLQMTVENGGATVDLGDMAPELKKMSLSPDCSPREEYLEWSEYFMAVSFLSAMRSKDPATQASRTWIKKVTPDSELSRDDMISF